MAKYMKKLRMAFSKKEKTEKLLSNLDKFKKEGSIADDQYNSMKTNYTQELNETESGIKQIKKEASRDLESEKRALETYKQELSNLEARFKVGEISADIYRRYEKRARNRIEKIETKILELNKLIDSKSSEDVGGYVDTTKHRSLSISGYFPTIDVILENKKIIIVGLIAFVIVTAFLSGFGSGNISAKDAMKMLPESDSFMYVNYEGSFDNDVGNILSKSAFSYDSNDILITSIGKLHYSALSDSVGLIGGGVDIEKIRQLLSKNDFQEDKHNGIEIWTNRDDTYALLENKILFGDKYDVFDAISVIKGEKESLYEHDKGMVEMIDRLPDGDIISVSSTSSTMGSSGILYFGISVQKINEDYLDVQMVFKCKDKYIAEDAFDELTESIEGEKEVLDAKISIHEEYIIITYRTYVDNLSDLINNEDGTMTSQTNIKDNIKEGLDKPILKRVFLEGGVRMLILPKEATKEMVDKSIAVLSTRISAGPKEMKLVPVKIGEKWHIQLDLAIPIYQTQDEEIHSLIEKQGKFEATINRYIDVPDEKGVFKLNGNSYDVDVTDDTIKIGEITAKINDSFVIDGISLKYTNYANDTITLSALVFNGEDIKQVFDDAQHTGIFGTGSNWRFEFSITISREAAERFAKVTSDLTKDFSGRWTYLSSNIDLYLDDELLDSLKISSDLQGKAQPDIQISGPGNSRDDAWKNMNNLLSILRSGALPTEIEIVKFDLVPPKK